MFDQVLDIFRGKAVTIPPLDGAFRPNTVLDDATELAGLSGASDLAVRGGVLLAGCGNAIYALAAGEQAVMEAEFPSPLTALAVSASGELAVGLESGTLLLGSRRIELPASIRCITALAFDADGTLWLANGSTNHAPSAWAADLMDKGASGSIWRRKPGAGFQQIVGGMAFPYGLLVKDTGVVVSESWRHRLVSVDVSGRQNVVLDNLPGYPARLSTAPDGGAWLSLFAPRNRLIEFVLQDNHFRRDMINTVPREYWVAPSLASNRSFLEPLQCGAIRSMGVHKPWSPTRSYGLVVELDAAMRPVSSLHSRADGSRHGTTSAVQLGGALLVASQGSGCVLTIDLAEAF